MTINALRLLMLLLVAQILWTRTFFLLYYLGAMWLSVEFLNRSPKYLQLPRHNFFNAVFGGFALFIVAKRTTQIQWAHFTEGVLNIVEHGFFALVICLKIWIYWGLFSEKTSHEKTILGILVFNGLGIFNEIFQNYLNNRALWVLIADAQKDLWVNGVGSLFFGIIMFILFAKKTPRL